MSSSFASTIPIALDSKKNTLHRPLSPIKNDEVRPLPPKKIDFNPTVRAKMVSRLVLFFETERSNTWYSSEEFVAIREGAINTVTRMAQNKAVDMDPNDSSRGLEGRTPKQDELRQERRRIIMRSVLAEQPEHDLDDYETSSLAISACYSLCNQSCVHEAMQ